MLSRELEISVKVFICYAHADQELRKKLEEHLGSLKNLGKITIWQDEEIPAGANWEDQIHARLNEAHMILLLVSSSFINSQYCWNKEVLPALERHKAGTTRVIPIILKPVAWQGSPLGQLHALPTGAKPVTQWDDLDAAFEDVVRGIQRVVEDLRVALREGAQRNEEIRGLIQEFESNFHPTIRSIDKERIQVMLSDSIFLTAPSHLGKALLEVTVQMRKVVEDLNTSKKVLIEPFPLSFECSEISAKDGRGRNNNSVLVQSESDGARQLFSSQALHDTRPSLLTFPRTGHTSLPRSKKVRSWLAALDYLCSAVLISSAYISVLFVLSWGVIWLVFASPLVLAERVFLIGGLFYWFFSIMLFLSLIGVYVKATNLAFLSLSSVLKRWRSISRSPAGAMKYFQMTSWIWRHQDASPARVEAVVVQRTKASVDEVHSRLGSRTYDETLSRLVDEHYTLNQLLSVLSPLSEQFGNQSPVETLQSLLDEGRIWRVDQELGERWKTSLQEVESLLTDAAVESDEPATYLRNLLAIKRNAKRSHVKDYSKMALLELRRAKTTEAAAERFRRAVAAIMAYNDSVTEPEMRWYISPTVVVNLVGGCPSDVKGYLLSRKDELDAHHNKFDPKITPGYNRHPMPITQRIKMEEASVGTTVESLEEAAVAE